MQTCDKAIFIAGGTDLSRNGAGFDGWLTTMGGIARAP